MDALYGHNAGVEMQEAASERHASNSKKPHPSPGAQSRQLLATPQSPLTKQAFIYENVDNIRVQNLRLDSSPFTASCPDISSQNVVNSKSSTFGSAVPNSLSVTVNNTRPSEIPSQMVQSEFVTSSKVDPSLHTYCNISDLAVKKTPPRQSPNVAICSTSTASGHSDYAQLIDIIKNQFPHTPAVTIKQALLRTGGDVEQAIKDIKLSKLNDMKVAGLTEADCRALLEQCDWDLSKAAEMLCS